MADTDAQATTPDGRSATAPAAEAAPAAGGAPPAAATADDDLLCTICNLKACWQAPPP